MVPCPEPMPAHDVAFRARQSGASLLIADRSAEADVEAVRAQARHQARGALPRRGRRPCSSDAGRSHRRRSRRRISYPFVLYTSGVTKEPKGVAHTHAATYAARMQARHWLDVGPRDIVWCTAGNWWGHSIWNALGCWSFGAEIVMHSGGFDPVERLDLLEFLGVSIVGQTAREYGLMAELDDLESVAPVASAPRRLGRRASEPCSDFPVSRGLRDRRLRRLRPGRERPAAGGRTVTHVPARVDGSPRPRASRRSDRRGRPRDAAGGGG